MYIFRTIPETDLAYSTVDSLTMLTTLLDPFVMIFNNKKSFMVHYLATAGLLLGQKSSFFTKNTLLGRKSLFSKL